MAPIMLVSWPFVVLMMFASMGPARGLIWTTVIGYLFLPTGISYDIPGLPPYEKTGAISYSALLATIIFFKKESYEGVQQVEPMFRRIIIALVVITFLAPVGTFLTNSEGIAIATSYRQPVVFRDVIGVNVQALIRITPFLLAWLLLRKPEHHREVLFAFVAVGLVYTLLALYEVRMSPQLSKQIYGIFPHSWRQHIRGGAFRPIIFLDHGISVGFFLFSAILSAFALSRDKTKNGVLFVMAAVWTLCVLIVSRNLGATMLAFMFFPLIFLTSLKVQVRLALVISMMFLSYPALKTYKLDPSNLAVNFASKINEERAGSLKFRLDNEEILLKRAAQKPYFGWGGWGRMRVYNEKGRDISILDGLWIIKIGQAGWIGYLSFFGIITLPIFFLRRAAARSGMTPAIGGMALITAGNLIYMVPNATLTPVGLLLMGTMASYVQYQARANDQKIADSLKTEAKTTRYTRFAVGDLASAGGSSAPPRSTPVLSRRF